MTVFALNPAEPCLMLLTPQEEKCDVTHTVFVVWMPTGLAEVGKK